MTAVGRSIDISRSSNRFAVALTFVAACLYGAFAVWSTRFDYFEAAVATIGVFLAWAIGRELDPQHPSVAALAGVATLGAGFLGIPAGLVCFAALVTVRLTAGTTGRWLKPIDVPVFAVVGFASGGAVWYWPIALILFMWLRSSPHAGPRRWWGVGALAIGFVTGWFIGNLDPVELSLKGAVIGFALAVVCVVAVSSVTVDVYDDAGRGTLSEHSVRLARAAAGVIVVCPVVLGGQAAIWNVAPISCALIATALVVVARAVRLMDRHSG